MKMREVFMNLILRFPISIHIIVSLLFTLVTLLIMSNFLLSLSVDFKWFYTFATITSALLAQVYFKLQDMRFIEDATVSELNRIGAEVNEWSKPVIKLVFFHFIVAIIVGAVTSMMCVPVKYDNLAASIVLSFIPLWCISLLFCYSTYQSVSNFKSELLKRRLEANSRKTNLDSLNESK